MRWGIKEEVVARADPVLLTSRPEPLKNKKKNKNTTTEAEMPEWPKF